MFWDINEEISLNGSTVVILILWWFQPYFIYPTLLIGYTEKIQQIIIVYFTIFWTVLKEIDQLKVWRLPVCIKKGTRRLHLMNQWNLMNVSLDSLYSHQINQQNPPNELNGSAWSFDVKTSLLLDEDVHSPVFVEPTLSKSYNFELSLLFFVNTHPNESNSNPFVFDSITYYLTFNKLST